jgi:phage shock protein A
MGGRDTDTNGAGMTEQDEPTVVDAEIVEDSTPVVPEGDYNQAGVPSFDYVRDRIEGRLATSVGAGELASETPEGASVDQQMEERDRAGREKLEQIRRSMRGE